jgi:1-acyl-sn-glycerol-3-phosphate acyltransferase
VFYWIIKGLAWPVMRLYLRFRRHGVEKIPRSGPCIVVANHTSYLDAGVLGTAYPRRLRFLLSAEIYRLLRMRWFYYMMGAIPLRTNGGDSGALRKALKTLRSGLGVGIFPEGQRMESGQLGEGKMGVSFLAWRSGAPVVPAAILGAHRAMPVGAILPRPLPVQVLFGEPLRFPEGPGKPDKETLLAFANDVMRKIADLGALPAEAIGGGPPEPAEGTSR